MKINKDRIIQLRNSFEARACGFRYQLQNSKKTKAVFFSGTLLLPLLLLLLVYFSASYTFNPLNGTYEHVQSDTLHQQPNHDSLRKQLIDYHNLEQVLKQKQNELQLAKQDSIYLKVNLADSSLIMGIKGIDVHSIALNQIRFSRNFNRILPALKSEWLQHIFSLDSSIATIAKEPIIVKQAPDMPDDSMPAPIPTMHDTLPVQYTLYFHPSLIIQVEQLEPINSVHDELISQYKKEARTPKQLGIFGKVFRHKHQEAVIVHMAMPAADAKAVYRAIPKQAKTLLNY